MYALPEQRSLDFNYKLLRVEIVDKNHYLYQQGRELAQKMYQKVWQTENLIDDNDYAVIVYDRNFVIANVNVQLKHPQTLLKSEKFFANKHWQNYLEIKDSEIAEISGLAICDRIPRSKSRLVLMALVLGMQTLLNILKLKAYTTVQHKFLIRVLIKSLKLPFFINSIMPGRDVPDDNYWKREEPPRIYYLDGLNSDAIAACNSFWHYFETANLKVNLRGAESQKIA